MNQIDKKLFDPKDLKLFDPILKRNGRATSIKTGAELHGFFMAIACNPEMGQPQEWLPLVWGKTLAEQPKWNSEKDLNEFSQLSFSLFYNCVKTLNEEKLTPYFEGKNRVDLAEWSKGFMRGFVFLQPYVNELLESFNNSKDIIATNKFLTKNKEETPEILAIKTKHMSSMFLAIVFRHNQLIQLESESGMSNEILEKEYVSLPNTLLYFRDYLINSANKNSKPKNNPIDRALNKIIPLHGEQKPDRNESCLCGSGKKYKKCCGNN